MRFSLIAGAFALLFTASPHFSAPAEAQSVRNETVICQSTNGQRNVCRVKGRIQDVQPVASYSSNPCLYGYSWGYGNRYVWVDKGCAAQFDVSVRTRRQQVVTPQPEPEPQPVPQPTAPAATSGPGHSGSASVLANASNAAVIAQGACTGLYPLGQSGGTFVFAVPRRCEQGSPDCSSVCARFSDTIEDPLFRAEIQKRRSSCFNSIHVYNRGEAAKDGAAGTMTHVYNDCRRGACGPNYCCCGAQQ